MRTIIEALGIWILICSGIITVIGATIGIHNIIGTKWLIAIIIFFGGWWTVFSICICLEKETRG